jgi:hypothetical protein
MLDPSPPAPTPARKSLQLCRSHNHRRWQLEKELLGSDERAPFVCECTGSDCLRPVELTMHEYESAHTSPDWCAVKPGHMPAGAGARLVLRYPHFWVVELPLSRDEP